MTRGGILALTLVVAACTGSVAPTSTTSPPSLPTTAQGVFEQLVEALQARDHARAARLTDQSQIALLAVAEGLGPREVTALTAADLEAVASNFWSGFSSQLESSLGVGLRGLRAGQIRDAQAGAARFAVVELTLPSDASVRRLVIRDTPSGWVIDLVASFPSPLLGFIPAAAEVIRVTGDEKLKGDLIGFEDSILFVLDDPDMPSQLNQAALAALEAIVR
jgi:hypothetical protein